jgi:hypothetical protein
MVTTRNVHGPVGMQCSLRLPIKLGRFSRWRTRALLPRSSASVQQKILSRPSSLEYLFFVVLSFKFVPLFHFFFCHFPFWNVRSNAQCPFKSLSVCLYAYTTLTAAEEIAIKFDIAEFYETFRATSVLV